MLRNGLRFCIHRQWRSQTKNYETETWTSLVNSIACESETNRMHIIYYIFEIISDE